MSESEFPREQKPDAMPPADTSADSLDFTDAGAANASEPAAVDHATPLERTRARRHAAHRRPSGIDRAAGRRFRRVAGPLLIVAVIAGMAYALTHRHSNVPETPLPSTTASVPQGPPAQEPPTVPPAMPRVETDAKANVQPLAVPAAFLQEYPKYAANPAPKAIALAFDLKGWAYGSVAAAATQAEADDAAVAHCERFRAQSEIQEKCRLYASGDQVVW